MPVLRAKVGGVWVPVSSGVQGPPGVPGVPGTGVPAGGTTGQVLAKLSNADYSTQWAAPAAGSMNNPMTGIGDLIIGASGGAPARLAPGSNGMWLTLSGGSPTWSAMTALVNPMTAPADLIMGATGGSPVRLPVGSEAQVLTVVAGALAWRTPGSGGGGGGMSNPMSQSGDLIIGASAGVPARLPIGTAGQVLMVVAGAPAWASNPALSNPMTQAGDMIIGASGGAPVRLPSVASGSVLASSGVGVAPAWSSNVSLTTFSATTVAVASLTQNNLVKTGPSGALNTLASVAAGSVLASAGVGVLPLWSASPSLTSLTLTGTLTAATAVLSGGITVSGLTPGSVLFVGPGNVLAQDTPNLFYDDTNDNLRLFGGTVASAGRKVLALGKGTSPGAAQANTVQITAGDIAFGEVGQFNIDSTGGAIGLSGRTLIMMPSTSSPPPEVAIDMNPNSTHGGHRLLLYTAGTGTGFPGGPGATGLWDTVTGPLAYWVNGQLALRVLNAAPRVVITGPPDSGGTGYRTLLIAN